MFTKRDVTHISVITFNITFIGYDHFIDVVQMNTINLFYTVQYSILGQTVLRMRVTPTSSVLFQIKLIKTIFNFMKHSLKNTIVIV